MKEKCLVRRLFTILICAIITLAVSLLPGVSLRAEGGETLMIGVPKDRCPIFYSDASTNEITGIGVDLMRAAAEEAGYRAEFCIIEEANLKDALDNPEYDVILPFGSAIESTSGQSSIVSENLIQTPFTLVTTGNRNLPSFNNLKVGMLKSLSGAADTVHELYPGIEIKMYETMPECVKALRKGEVDALLHNSYVWSYVLQKPSYSDLKVQPSQMFSMDFRAGTTDTPEGKKIISRLDRGIVALSDTRKQAVILDHTSRKLYQYTISDYLYEYGALLLLIALLFIALVIIAIQRSYTVRKEQEEKMQEMIDHDPLTGVLSMSGFRKRVEILLHEHPDIPYLLAFVNIKNFKYINDSFGRDAGDDLLKFWAEKTMETLSEEEAMCRIGADRFAVLRRLGGDEKLINDDENVVESVRNYFIDKGKDNRVQICGGVYVLISEDYKNADVDHMLDFARVAEKRVRETRSDGYEFYNPEQWERGKQIANVVNYLHKAMKSGDIRVWYQPQVDYETGKITGAEALCRWKHANLNWISPADFIPTLEEAGLIYDLDSFVWERVCQDLHRWNEAGIKRCVSVNVSRCDVNKERDIAEIFRKLVQTYKLTPDQLSIEITETAFAENAEMLFSATEKLREYGFKVEMDDFGSGYSSLHMLKEVSVDRIKLDLRFLTDAGDQKKGHIIIGYMVRMIHSLGMEIITEGVETAEQVDFLLAEGSPEMQGYYFYRPMPVEEFDVLSENWKKTE